MSTVGAPRKHSTISAGHRASKSWLAVDQRALAQAEGQDDAGIAIVKCTTRFATCMCVIIAFVKVSLYLYTGAEVVRTSALDSLGDLLANCMTLYTGYRMTRIEPKRYPVGQGKFQSIGCLVFSTFMFALMFGNSLGNVESLIESKDQVGLAATSRFFYKTEELGEPFSEWKKEVYWDGDEFKWNESTDEGIKTMKNPLIKYYEKEADDEKDEQLKESYKEMAEAYKKKGDVTKGELVAETAEYENDVELERKLYEQNGFLGLCATYKLCLWLYCICYAIPKSGSGVLVALATDKRNDFIGTFTVITATMFFFWQRENITFIDEDKVDPAVSLCLSIFIMYSWSSLMVEHMTLLSQEASEEEFAQGIRDRVHEELKGTSCRCSDEEIKIYQSSEKHTIEISLSATDGNASHSDVATVAKVVQKKLEGMEDVERVVMRY